MWSRCTTGGKGFQLKTRVEWKLGITLYDLVKTVVQTVLLMDTSALCHVVSSPLYYHLLSAPFAFLDVSDPVQPQGGRYLSAVQCQLHQAQLHTISLFSQSPTGLYVYSQSEIREVNGLLKEFLFNVPFVVLCAREKHRILFDFSLSLRLVLSSGCWLLLNVL